MVLKKLSSRQEIEQTFANSIFFSNFEGRFLPRMPPFGLKLWENAFQMIPDISFFDAKQKMFDENVRQNCFRQPPENIFSKVPVLEDL